MATIEGSVLGAATAYFPDRDNPTLCWSELEVDPFHWGQGVGTALARWLEDRVRDNERMTILGEEFAPVGEREHHAARSFAEKRGYSIANIEVVRSLELPVAPEVLDALGAGSYEAMGRYEVSVHRNGVPDELRPSLCAAMNRLTLDAPSRDVDVEAGR